MRDYNELPDDEVVLRMEHANKRVKEQLLNVGVPDIKAEDRIKRYSFNVDGKIVDLDVSDRQIVLALKLHEPLVEALKEALNDYGFEYGLEADTEEWKKLIAEAETV